MIGDSRDAKSMLTYEVWRPTAIIIGDETKRVQYDRFLRKLIKVMLPHLSNKWPCTVTAIRDALDMVTEDDSVLPPWLLLFGEKPEGFSLKEASRYVGEYILPIDPKILNGGGGKYSSAIASLMSSGDMKDASERFSLLYVYHHMESGTFRIGTCGKGSQRLTDAKVELNKLLFKHRDSVKERRVGQNRSI